MLATVTTATLAGIDALLCRVEVDVGRGLPGIHLLGLSDLGAREGRDRVRAALRNRGYEVPMHKVTINLAPVALRKEGAVCDLAIALGLLRATSQLTEEAERRLDQTVVTGELGLDGSLRAVRGALAFAWTAREAGYRRLLCPRENAAEAAAVPGIEAIGVSDLEEAVLHLGGEREVPAARPREAVSAEGAGSLLDLSEVRGQETAKRAIVLAAAGGHNVLLSGPPGSGKTMLARCLRGLLPPLADDEALEVTRIASVAGLLRRGGLVREAPFRAPHHTATEAALIGGGRPIRPGEVTLAHRGVLFLDELPEFGARTLDTLRQPVEEGVVRIGRAQGTVTFPARFLCVAAMNPCPCGQARPGMPCRCSPLMVQRYAGRVSGPLRDRFDLTVHVQAVPIRELEIGRPAPPPGEWTTAAQRKRVVTARARQIARQGCLNAELWGPALRRHARLRAPVRARLVEVAEARGLSARRVDRVRRMARTAADLEERAELDEADLFAALLQSDVFDRSGAIDAPPARARAAAGARPRQTA